MTSYDPAALAASFLLHRVNYDTEGMNAVVATLNEQSHTTILTDFIEYLADYALGYGLNVHGGSREALRSQLQGAVMHFESTDFDNSDGDG